jgi:acetyl esterase/lipase
MNPFGDKARRHTGDKGQPALPHLPVPKVPNAKDVILPHLPKGKDRPTSPTLPRLVPELRLPSLPKPGPKLGKPSFGPRPAPEPEANPLPSGIPSKTASIRALTAAAALVAEATPDAPGQGEADGRMSPAAQWVGNRSKDLYNGVMTTRASVRPLSDDLVCFGDLSYEGPDGTELLADVYRPKDRTADPLPIVVLVHGGALLMGTRKAIRDYAMPLAERGYVVFIPEYRVLEEADGIGSITDVCAGLSYLASHAREFGGDPSRVLVNAESAGAFPALYVTAAMGSEQLQEALGIQTPELSVRGLACFGGMLYTTPDDPVGLVYHRAIHGERLHDEDFMELMNPEDRRVVAALPPVLQVTSGADFLKAHTLRYDEALEKAGHEHRLIYYAEGRELTHAFPSLRPELPQSGEVLDELDAWFRGLSGPQPRGSATPAPAE